MLIGIVNNICGVRIAVGRQVKNKISVQREAVAVAAGVGCANIDLMGERVNAVR